MTWDRSEKKIFLTRIYELKRRRAYSEMEEESKTALDRYPGEAIFQILLAEAFLYQRRFAEVEAIREGLKGRAEQMHEYQALQGALEMDRRRYPKALECLRSAYSLKPSDYYLKRQADCLIALGEYDEALALLRSLPSGRASYTLNSMARAYEGLGRVAEARECYENALKLNPKDTLAAPALLRLKAAEKKPEEADRELDRVLRLPSRRQDSALLRVKADRLKERGNFKEAAELYLQLAGASEPREREFYRRSAAFAFYKAGAWGEAYALLKELIESDPQDVYVRSTLVATARRSGRTAELADFLYALGRQSAANRALLGIARSLRAKC